MTRNQAGIDFDQHPPRTADGRDASQVYAADRGIAAMEEMRIFEEAERRTLEGYRGTILDPLAPDHVKHGVAEKLANLPHWTEETRKERREIAEKLRAQQAQQRQQGQQE
ncbi:hypothetical protein JCM10213v2_006354 [Rhodosporidiobolus nylandii]